MRKKLRRYHVLFFLCFLLLVSSFILVASKYKRPTVTNQWAFEKIQLKEAWKVTKGKGAKIAVIDSGFDVTRNAGRIVNVEYEDSIEAGPQDAIGHGTQTINLIAAVCPECQFIAIKIGRRTGNTAIGSAIHKAVDSGANVINLSFIITEKMGYEIKSITREVCRVIGIK